MRVLLLSTYELGAQPLGCAVPAALLEQAGHEVRSVDLSLEPLRDEDVAWAAAACVSVPMHTALRLAVPVLERLRAAGMPVALHGLYAPVGASAGLLGAGDLAVAGESGDSLLAWLDGLAGPDGSERIAVLGETTGLDGLGTSPARPGPAVRVALGRARPSRLVPSRRGLPGLERYARLVGGPAGDGERLVGTVEATRGCSHRCRHCPVPVIYDGRTRAVEVGALLEDVDGLVALGAGHLHFADPDFLNRPTHALSVVRAVHARHPELSYDVTAKVSHVLRHRTALRELAATGCAFVVSAVESLSPVVLERLDKGHDAAGAAEAIGLLRAAGIEPRPSLLPFTPWTTPGDLVELLDFVARHDLVWNVDPVQWGIRLLLPPGSLLLAEPDEVLAAAVRRAAADRGELIEALGVSWAHADPLLDELQLEIAALVELADAAGEEPPETFGAVRRLVLERVGLPGGGFPGGVTPVGGTPTGPRPELVAASGLAGAQRPRLTESWFCCAEPSSAQLALASTGGAATTVSRCPTPSSRPPADGGRAATTAGADRAAPGAEREAARPAAGACPWTRGSG
ncbi:MAG TPA: radical SAM protein [Acidimicrobiales bacterium]|nr:radical SAM protein [Acidimicrobiales bacterium]